MSEKFYAHSLDGKPPEEWQGLEEYLLSAFSKDLNAEGTVPDLRTERSVGVESGLSPAKRIVKKFWDEFGSGDWAYLAGLWHDLERKG